MKKYIKGLKLIITIALTLQFLFLIISINDIESIIWDANLYEMKTSKLDSISFFRSGKNNTSVNFVGFINDSERTLQLFFEPGRSMKYTKTAENNKVVNYWIKKNDTIGYIANNQKEQFNENWKYETYEWSIYRLIILFGLFLFLSLFFNTQKVVPLPHDKNKTTKP